MAGEQLVQLMHQAARDTFENLSPAELVNGVVLSAAPLSVRVDNRFTVGEGFLILSPLCRPFVTDVFRHRHEQPEPTDYQLESVVVWRGLKAGDKVRMIRCSHGQLYYILEREGDL